jgi:hypothetical protein
MSKKNLFTKMIWLRDVADEKQLFTLQCRNKAVQYNVQTKEGKMIVITSKRSGKTIRKKEKTNVYVKE